MKMTDISGRTARDLAPNVEGRTDLLGDIVPGSMGAGPTGF